MKLMKRIETFSVRFKRVPAAGLLILVVAAVGVATGAWAKYSTITLSVASAVQTGTFAKNPETPILQRQGRKIAEFESELITVTPHGFEPREISRPRGQFLLMIDNRSGLAEVSPLLTREAGAQVRSLRVPREEPNWSEVVDFPPGRYLLTEANHQAWTCLITINAH